MHFFRKIISLLPIAIVLCFLISQFSLHFGNKQLAEDRLPEAKILYVLATIFSPFDANVQIRLIATNTMLLERQDTSEDYNPKTLAKLSEDQYVLGTTTQVPVLMYHYIRVNPWPSDKVGFSLSVTPYDFASQLDWLQNHGYHTISLDELGANLLYGTSLPSKPIVLTFDDGYRDFYTAAYPELKKRNLKALNFVITGFVGLPQYLTWNEITEMSKSGLITFGAHTVNHVAMTYLSDENDLQELTKSKQDLEAHLHYPINWFAYPFGNSDSRTAFLVKQAGFLGAFTTKPGTAQTTDTLFLQPRVRIGGGMGVTGFADSLPWN